MPTAAPISAAALKLQQQQQQKKKKGVLSFLLVNIPLLRSQPHHIAILRTVSIINLEFMHFECYQGAQVALVFTEIH